MFNQGEEMKRLVRGQRPRPVVLRALCPGVIVLTPDALFWARVAPVRLAAVHTHTLVLRSWGDIPGVRDAGEFLCAESLLTGRGRAF